VQKLQAKKAMSIFSFLSTLRNCFLSFFCLIILCSFPSEKKECQTLLVKDKAVIGLSVGMPYMAVLIGNILGANQPLRVNCANFNPGHQINIQGA